MAGAFQTSRDIFENPIWQNIVEFRLFFLIYGKATFIDGVKIGNVILNRGQWIRSFRNLQSDLEYIENRSVKKYSLSTIHRAVDNLLKQERIKILECELGTLFEVVNYAKYQGLDNYKSNIENGERTEREQQENGNETEREQQENNNKKLNKGKKLKKIKDIYITVQHLSMSEEEYKKLISAFGEGLVKDKIEYAENYKKLKNYNSLYLTLNNWLKADKAKIPQDQYRRVE